MIPNERIVKFVSDTDYSQLSQNLIQHTKLCILDTIGATVVGSPQVLVVFLVDNKNDHGRPRCLFGELPRHSYNA